MSTTSTVATHLPPGSAGLPVLGGTLSILGDALGFTRQQAARYGQVFQTSFMGQHAVVLLGADAQKQVLGASTAETLYSSYGGYRVSSALHRRWIPTDARRRRARYSAQSGRAGLSQPALRRLHGAHHAECCFRQRHVEYTRLNGDDNTAHVLHRRP